MLATTSSTASLRNTLRSAVDNAPLSKQDIAQRAGISRRALYSLLEGAADPRLSTLEALSHVLGLDLFIAPKAVHQIQLGSASTGKRSEHSRVRRLLEEGAGRSPQG
ncbi:helix-turn-helix domain-containing protein [Hydrogenophaga sp.]|uniref:helix-turn-helix domain-containing protein n=1 Tax=Hydrogenophaga sp. TaxID=1904254 RepID=UPI002726FA19|nr:helix-turn-helix transcriptional regulator [Hydrogenophaga sp.]MDO9438868.1 helix-turn-helix transcriptional regulator [Hydrogenophaga sp.]